MKIPRDLSGHDLVTALCRHWGYTKVNQVGSHIILQTQDPTQHRVAVPAYKSYDSAATSHAAGSTYIVKTWKSDAQAIADYGAKCTMPGTNTATDCSEPHEPYLNMIYVRSLFDYLVTYRLQEWLNPGYLERMERTMKDKQGIEFNFRPTQYSR